MKKYLLTTLLILLFWPLHLSAQQSHGTIKESLTMDSKILGKEISFSIYLPPDYEESNRSYPVLYLLHGYSDNETGWTQFGEVKNIMDQQVSKTSVTPMIIAMPDAPRSGKPREVDAEMRSRVIHLACQRTDSGTQKYSQLEIAEHTKISQSHVSRASSGGHYSIDN